MTAVMLLVAGLASPSLSEPHRTFLEDVAHFLLTTRDRERFLALETEELRDGFIDRFWREHDASVHTERLRACDRLFGARGRWSPRGRIYQWLGAPSYREDLTRAGHRLVPIELWLYTGVELSFLPDAFYLVFFRSGGAGEFRLWNPDTDGIQALVPSAEPNRARLDLDAGNVLERFDPELALAVESLVPGGGRRETRSLLASLSSLPELAEGAVESNVRVVATTRELPARLLTATWRDEAGVPEVHYALELRAGAADTLRWRQQADRFRARFTLVGKLMAAGSTRERWEDVVELDVSAAERRALAATRLIFKGRRLSRAEDDRLELALVTDGAGVVVSADVKPLPELDEGDVRESESRGWFLSELDRGSMPVRVLERSRTDGEAARYRFARGLAFAKQGSLDRAIDELERAAELDADDVRIHLELARLLYASRDYAAVLSHLSSAGTRWDDEVDVWVLRAGAAEALGRADAVAYYEKALVLAPGNEAIADALAMARRRTPR